MFRIVIFSMVYLLSVSCSEKKVIKTPEEFAKSVITSIAQKDFDKFEEHLFDIDNFRELIENAEYETDADKELVLSTLKERYNGYWNENKAYFEKLSPQSLEYVVCRYELLLDGDIEYTDGFYMIAKSGDTTKEIGFTRLVKTKSGWKSLGIFEVK